jgi:hypothetical protein
MTEELPTSDSAVSDVARGSWKMYVHYSLRDV